VRHDTPPDVRALITIVEQTADPAAQIAADAVAIAGAKAADRARQWERVLGWLGGCAAGVVTSAAEVHGHCDQGT